MRIYPLYRECAPWRSCRGAHSVKDAVEGSAHKTQAAVGGEQDKTLNVQRMAILGADALWCNACLIGESPWLGHEGGVVAMGRRVEGAGLEAADETADDFCWRIGVVVVFPKDGAAKEP